MFILTEKQKDILTKRVYSLPKSSGVYQYLDKNGKILYIGKAKNLESRVKNYFKLQPSLDINDSLSNRIKSMLSQTFDVVYTIVDSENDALILENSLIKELNPKYNILLRDDKTFPYLYFDFSKDYPTLELTRSLDVNTKGIKYYGPFVKAGKEIALSINELLPLVQRKSCLKDGKSCIYFQMNRCLAPCEGRVDKSSYLKIVKKAISLIENRELLIERLKDKMLFFANNLKFEEAKVLRDRIELLNSISINSDLDLAKSSDLDVIYIRGDSKSYNILIMFVRVGRVISFDSTIVKDNFVDICDEVYERAIMNLYRAKNISVPSQIIINRDIKSFELIKDFFKKEFNKSIDIIYPKNGVKKRLLDIAQKNSLETFKFKLENDNNILRESLVELLKLDNMPFRIEIFDNSHNMGTICIGAMVVYESNFIKKSYRAFNLNAKDEYTQMKELLLNRADRFNKSYPPNLWIIDGGRTLLELAVSIVESSGANIDVIAISKEKYDNKSRRAKSLAKDLIHTKDKTFKLDGMDNRLLFIQMLRDEAHRFAINFHRRSKIKDDNRVSLMQINGIGKAKIEKLLNYFGTFKNIKNASISELELILNSKDSNSVYDFFKDLKKEE